MLLTAHNKYIDTACLSGLFTQGEKYSDKIYFLIDRVNNDVDLTDCAFTIRAVNENGNMTDSVLGKLVQESDILLTWEISEYITACAGTLNLEIIGIKGDAVIIKYKMKPISIRKSILGEGLPEPDIIEKKLLEMQEILSAAQDIAVKTPYIQDDSWYVWSIAENCYINSGVSAAGQKGEKGEPGTDGLNGRDGTNGKDGIDGKDGLSAYEIWLAQGHTGTESDFLASLKGEAGTNGKDGADGVNGRDGLNGKDGTDGQNGLSAYETWLSLGNIGSEADFIASLKGRNGTDGKDGENGKNGTDGKNGENGTDGFSPVAVVSSFGSTITITITDISGTTNVSFCAPDQAQLDAITQSVAALHSVDISLESRIAALEASSGGGGRLSLYSAGSHLYYEEKIHLQLNGTIYSLSEFTELYPDFCSAENEYALHYSFFLGWDTQVFTCSTSSIRINSNSLIAMTFIAGSTEIGVLRLVKSDSGTPEDILTKAQTDGNYIDLSFQWLYSDTYITTLSSCENVTAGDYYLAWLGRSNNSHPLINSITIIS